MRLLRFLLIAGSAGVAALALAVGSVHAAAPGLARQPASYRPSARFLAEARTALVRYLHFDHPQIDFVHPGSAHAGLAGTSLVGSYNWSGYADTSTVHGTFSKVSGQWTTPAVSCTSEDTLTSDWVGLDGLTDGTVEQDGTISWCFEDRATYFTWYEMYPAGTVEVGTSLEPGDKITATVSHVGTSYTLALTDSTRPANSFTKTATCAAATCLDTSAEWIAERPAFAIGVTPLAAYGTWHLAAATETAAGTVGTISSYAANDEILMVDATDHYYLSTPSALTGGNSFVATWRDSY
jgi:hypothetical protein